MIDTEARKTLIYNHLEKPYKQLIKKYIAIGNSELISQEVVNVSLSLPEAVQQNLRIITDKMSQYTIGNKLWFRPTGTLVTVASVLLNESNPDILIGDHRNDGPILSTLVDINTLAFAQLAIESPDFHEMVFNYSV